MNPFAILLSFGVAAVAILVGGRSVRRVELHADEPDDVDLETIDATIEEPEPPPVEVKVEAKPAPESAPRERRAPDPEPPPPEVSP